MYQNKLLDSYKQAKNYVQDKQIAHDLGITPAKVSKIRSGERFLSETEALYIASELNLSTAEVLLYLAADRSKNVKAQETWDSLIKKFSSQGMIKLHSVTLIGTGLATLLTSKIECALYVLC